MTVPRLLWFAPITVGCGGTTLAAGASDVLVTKAEPSGDCEDLGAVYGSGAGAALVSSESKLRNAQNDLRNSAAERGADWVVLDSASADTSEVAYAGRAYRCGGADKEQSAVVVHESPNPTRKTSEQKQLKMEILPQVAAEHAVIKEQSAPPAQSDDGSPLPQGAGGFRFGDSREQVADACVNQDFVWTLQQGSARCSGLPVSLGDPGEAQVFFCQKQLCKVAVTLRPAEAGFVARFADIERRLTDRYGEPRQGRNTLGDCKAKLSKCIKEEPVRLEWAFPSGQAIQLEAIEANEAPRLLMTHSLSKKPPEKKPEPNLPAL